MNVYVVYWEDEAHDQPPHRVADPIMRSYCEVQIGRSANEVADRYLGRFDKVTIYPIQMKTADPLIFHAGMIEEDPKF